MNLLLIAPLLFGTDLNQQDTPNPYVIYDSLMDYGKTTKSLDIWFSHTTYDHVFKTVTYAQGRLYWESSARWTLYEKPVAHEAKIETVRGKDYSVRPGQAACWLRNGNELVDIDYATGRRQVFVNEVPDETGVASTIRIVSGIPRLADFGPYRMTTDLENGKVLVDLEPTGAVQVTPMFGRSYKQLPPGISMLLNPETFRPTAIKMTDQSKENVYVIRRESRSVVPPDRDEILFPCPWIFQEELVAEPTPTSEGYAMAFDLLAGFVQFLVPGF